MKLDKLKKKACILLAATFITSACAGCNKKDTQPDEKNYYDYIKNLYVVDYFDINHEEKHAVVYLFESFLGGYKLYDAFRSNNLTITYGTSKQALENFGNELGTYVDNELFIKYLTAEYGFKSTYTDSEIKAVIDKIDTYKIEDELDTSIVYSDDDTNEKIKTLR